MLLDRVTLTTGSDELVIDRSLPAMTGGGRAGVMLDVATFGPPRRALARTPLQYARGELVTPGLHLAREVTISGWIIGRTRAETNELLAELTRIVGDTGTDPILLTYEPQPGLELELAVFGDERPLEVETNDGISLGFTANFVAADPVAYRAGPFNDVVLSGAATTLTVGGDAPVWPTVTVFGSTSGTTTELRIENLTTGLTFELTGITFTAGEIITVSMAPGAESADEDGANRMGKRSATSRFWSLRPGTNSVRLSWTGGSGVTGSIEWRDGWLGW